MAKTLIVAITPVAFGLMGMTAAYLDHGYSPVVCMCFGAFAGLGIALFAERLHYRACRIFQTIRIGEPLG